MSVGTKPSFCFLNPFLHPITGLSFTETFSAQLPRAAGWDGAAPCQTPLSLLLSQLGSPGLLRLPRASPHALITSPQDLITLKEGQLAEAPPCFMHIYKHISIFGAGPAPRRPFVAAAPGLRGRAALGGARGSGREEEEEKEEEEEEEEGRRRRRKEAGAGAVTRLPHGRGLQGRPGAGEIPAGGGGRRRRGQVCAHHPVHPGEGSAAMGAPLPSQPLPFPSRPLPAAPPGPGRCPRRRGGAAPGPAPPRGGEGEGKGRGKGGGSAGRGPPALGSLLCFRVAAGPGLVRGGLWGNATRGEVRAGGLTGGGGAALCEGFLQGVATK